LNESFYIQVSTFTYSAARKLRQDRVLVQNEIMLDGTHDFKDNEKNFGFVAARGYFRRTRRREHFCSKSPNPN
jgi:hypothetical protein